jgi:hypothetical protein
LSDPRVLYGRTPEVCDFVAALIDVEDFGNCQAIGFLDRSGNLEAGAVYNNWNTKARVIEISMASAHRAWGTKTRLKLIFEYPFSFARMVVARTSANNPVPLRLWRALGANEYRIVGLRGPDEDEIVTTLTVDQWRGKYGRR